LARELNVSRSTICRDIAYLLHLGWPCPTCGAYTQPPNLLFRDDLDEDDEAPASAAPVTPT
jgi:predicted DNA-binding transcriptional regulator YafY